MKCPHCQANMSAPVQVCGQCGFSEQALSSYLGDQWIRLERVADTTHSLRLEQRRALDIALDDFEREFPQCFIAVYIGPLPKLLNPVEMGMWLLNHGAYSTQQFAKRNEYGIVITLDPGARRHGISLGYAIEGILLSPCLESILNDMTHHLRHNDLGSALHLATRLIGRQLRRAGRSERRPLDTSSPPQRSGNPKDFGLTPLRQGHRSPIETSNHAE